MSNGLIKRFLQAPKGDVVPAPENDARAGISPMYFSLRTLAVYSGLSNRTLREYIHDGVHPLPHFRIGGKILVKRDDFDQWLTQFRRVTPSIDVGAIVDDVMRSVGGRRNK